MANGDLLPLSDRVLRYCSKRRFQGGQISAENFEPLPKDKGALSTVWVECLHVAEDQRTIPCAVEQLYRQIRRRRDQDQVACLQVSAVRSVACRYGPLQVFEDWGPSLNMRHAVIRWIAGVQGEALMDFTAGAELARIARLNSFPADPTC